MRYTRLRRAIESGTLIGTHGTPFQGNADKPTDKPTDIQKKPKKSPGASGEQDTRIAQEHKNAREIRKPESLVSPSDYEDVAQMSDTEDTPTKGKNESVNEVLTTPTKSGAFNPYILDLSMNRTTPTKDKSSRRISSTMAPDSFVSSQENSPCIREPKRRRSSNSTAAYPLQQSSGFHSLDPTTTAGYNNTADSIKAGHVSKSALKLKRAVAMVPNHSPSGLSPNLKLEDGDADMSFDQI